jgi:alanyl-tRNA synthetase
MFEMLGNWSFGDYFKKEAIEWAWELLTEVYQLPKDRLYVTVFEGDEKESIPRSVVALELWKQLVPEDHIVYGNKKDNFWEMGETGPCGPCSEIHFDGRSDEDRLKISGQSLVNRDHPEVIEIWNNVFMMYNRLKDGTLEPLPSTHVDTGMGFERLVRVLQGKNSNYDTDVFTPIIQVIEKMSGMQYKGTPEKSDVAFRVISDHVRAVSFAIADGQLPSSGGAGYVIRRILRRAIRYGYSFLGFKEPFICQLVPVLAEQMGEFFPEIKSGQSLVSKVIREEEESFLRTLDKGIQLLDEIIRKTSGDVIDGKIVFELYDTFGFPADLTALIAAEGKKRIDQLGFEAELQKQKERSRAATKLETEDWVSLEEGETSFVGYDELECDTKILRYRKIKAKGKESFQLVLSRTPFYAESGGQVGDQGRLVSANEQIHIVDTKKENNLIVHFTDTLPEHPQAAFRAVVDGERRVSITSNHSATHLLHEALREVLGTHVEQKGSLVSPDYLRFDFSHFSKMSDEEVAKVETLVNERIRKNFPLEENRSMSIEDARKTGAMMLFGEKYGDVVRVIKFGDSIELCGGTHVQNTGEIGMFRIQSEGAVAAGVRRVEAISGDGAFNYINSELETLDQVRQVLKAKDVLKSIADLQARNADLQKQIEKLNKEKGVQVKQQLKSKITLVGDVEFIAEHVDLDAAELKDVAFQLKGEHAKLFGMFASQANGKATITCVISEALAAERSLNAGNIIRELAKEINGGGGGQAFFATAGGTNPDGLSTVLEKAKSYIS